MIKARKTCDRASLQVIPGIGIFVCQKTVFLSTCIRNHAYLDRICVWQLSNNNCFINLKDCLVFHRNWIKSLSIFIKKHKNHLDSCKINDRDELLTGKMGSFWQHQASTEPKPENYRDYLKVCWKLYRSILGKYRYTSLELAICCLGVWDAMGDSKPVTQHP